MKKMKSVGSKEKFKTESSKKRVAGGSGWVRYQDLERDTDSKPRWWWLKERLRSERRRLAEQSRRG